MVYLEQIFLWNGKNKWYWWSLHDNNLKWYDHIQENKSIVTYDTNLDL